MALCNMCVTSPTPLCGECYQIHTKGFTYLTIVLLKFRSFQDEYDSYLAYILEQNRVTRHKSLYAQIPSITKAKSVAEAVRLQQIRLDNLENEVRLLLKENDR